MHQRRPVPGPPVPAPAERACTIAARGCQPALLPLADPSADATPGGSDAFPAPPAAGDAAEQLAETGPEPRSAERIVPILHHVFADGRAALLFDEVDPVVTTARPIGPAATTVTLPTVDGPRPVAGSAREPAMTLELTDAAPVALRTPVRGLLWITGVLRRLTAAEARAEAVAVAAERPDPRLLDLGYGAVLLRLDPLSLVLADAEGSHAIAPAAFRAAEPDPFCLLEAGWLRHVETRHPDVIGSLTRQLPDDLRGGHVRPLGLDRLGLRLRVEGATGDHDVRLAFSRPVGTAAELAVELRRLLGCPFLAAQSRD